MFEFFESRENRRAFKKALEEIAMEEASILQGKHTSDTTITRVYKTNDETTGGNAASLKVKNPLRKPETTAVDLKNFKDWRKVNKVPSSHPQYPTNKKLFIDEEEDEEPMIKAPSSLEKSSSSVSSLDIISRLSENPAKQETDKSITTYYKQTQTKEKPKEPDKKQVTNQNIRELIEKFAPGEIAKHEKLKAEKDALTSSEAKEAKIKIEVVDFSNKQTPEKPKKKVNRRPRGKSKRRFDADVISSVEWK